MTRRLAPVLVAVLALAAPALGNDIARKQQVEQAIQANQAKLAATRASELTLRTQIAALDNRIGGLEAKVGAVSGHLSVLESDLALRRRRLDDLTQLYRLQTRRLDALTKEYEHSVAVLNRRLVVIYESGSPTTLDFVLGSNSINDIIEKIHFATLIGNEDKKIAAEVEHAKLRVQGQRVQTRRMRLKVRQDERALAVRAEQAQQARDSLAGAANTLSLSRRRQASDLSSLSAQDQALAGQIAAEQAESARLTIAIQGVQTHSSVTATPSSAGLIWPVNGPITSPFGPRWGSFHPGIDIGVPEGTPIEAAAAGTVIYCGWETGYGNLVVLDNGNNLATAYAHQSRIAVACGERVGQGQVLGYSGCTGYCTGPHVHFEVRIDGQPVDPMGYLP